MNAADSKFWQSKYGLIGGKSAQKTFAQFGSWAFRNSHKPLNTSRNLNRSITNETKDSAASSIRTPRTSASHSTTFLHSALHALPFPRNKNFFSRQDLLFDIHNELNQAPPGQYNVVALNGLTGVGKTQIALEYCYRYREDYEKIIWLRADTVQTLMEDIAVAARNSLRPISRAALTSGDVEIAWQELMQTAGLFSTA